LLVRNIGLDLGRPGHQALLIVCLFGVILGGINLVAVYKASFYGFVVPARDPEAIRERLLYLAENPSILRRIGAAARATIEEETPQSFSEFYGRKLKCSMLNGAAA